MSKLTIRYKPVSELSGYSRNARQHSAEQIQALCRSLREFGFTNPILIDSSGTIVAGHGRLEAAKIVGLTEVPTINLGHLTDAQRRAYAIADNKIPLQASWDMDLLSAELKALELEDFDLSLTGFDSSELDRLLKELQPPLPEEKDEDEDDTFDSGDDQADESGLDEDDYRPEATPKNTGPKASDEDYSTFELVMLHSNKLLLVETLNKLRQERHFEKIEDALMHLIKSYNEGKLDA